MTTGEVIALIKAYGGGGGGSGLPDTPGSNGSYTLMNTVESGEGALSWVSGGGALIVDFTAQGVTTTTYKDLKDALDAKTPVFVSYSAAGSPCMAPVTVQMQNQGGSKKYFFCAFTNINTTGINAKIYYLSVDKKLETDGVLTGFSYNNYIEIAPIS